MILKAITFNMCHGEGLDGSIDVRKQATFLKKFKPDIIFLQEIDLYTPIKIALTQQIPIY